MAKRERGSMVVAAVGTYCHGFDQLVEAFDQSCKLLEIDGFAQIGHSTHEPNYVAFDRFLPKSDLITMMGHSRLVVCHAGMGTVGDAMRAGAEIIMVPRRAMLNADEPTNDQLDFALATAERFGVGICLNPSDLLQVMDETLRRAPKRRHYDVQSNVNNLVAGILRDSAHS